MIGQFGEGLGRPWSWVCDDAGTAEELSRVLSGYGVKPLLGDMGLATIEEIVIVDEVCREYFCKLRAVVGGEN